MKLIFCADPTHQHEPDSQFTDEVASATHAGLGFHLIDYDALTRENNPARAVRDVPVSTVVEAAIYRGWGLTVRQYERLYDALLSRGLRLMTAPEAYRKARYLPDFLPLIEAHTPRTVWTHTDAHQIDVATLMPLLEKFAGQPVILRDFVQALKHYWTEACYIASASNEALVAGTIERFVALRGEHFVGGLVFREYVEFKALGDEMRGGKPIINEYRIVWLAGRAIATLCYWDKGTYTGIAPNPADFEAVALAVDNPFFVMDVALRPDGRWQILELDDAQIIALPESTDYESIYRAMASLG